MEVKLSKIEINLIETLLMGYKMLGKGGPVSEGLSKKLAAEPVESKYVVRDSMIQCYMGDHGMYNNSVTWTRCIFKDGQEIDIQYLRRDFANEAEVNQFSDILHKQFQNPAFEELEKDFYARNGGKA